MIVVLGRPGLTADDHIDRPAGRIALAAARAGGRVELVGSVGDDADGDQVIVALGQAGIGHAAVLRDPAGKTPHADADADAGSQLLPRLDAADVDLGLRYLAECQVLIAAEDFPADVLRVVSDAAVYHGAALVLLTAEGQVPEGDLAPAAMVLEAPRDDGGAFSELVGRYAASLDSGRLPADAWADAVSEGGWETGAE